MAGCRFGLGAALVLAGAACSCEDRLGPVDGLAVVDPSTVDFGRVAVGYTGRRTVAVRNIGRAPLAIERVRIEGLGQDVEVNNLGDAVLAAGQQTRLEILYRPVAEQLLDRTLRLSVDDRRRPELRVRVTGVALRPRVLPDPVLLDFGRIEIGERERRALFLRNDFDLPVEVRLGRRGDEQFSSSAGGRVEVPAHSIVDVQATFDARREGDANAELTLVPCRTCTELLVHLRGTGLDRALALDPELLDFGNVPIDRYAVRPLTLTNVATKDVEVHAVETDAARPSFRTAQPWVAMTLAPGQSREVGVLFGPTQLGADRSTLTVRSSSRRAPAIQVALAGFGGGPEITVVPPALDFGRVPAGGIYDRPLTISNAGSDPNLPPLQIASVRVEPAGAPVRLELPPDPIVLAPSAAAVINVVYEPRAAGRIEAAIVIESNDGSTPAVTVPVRAASSDAPVCILRVTPPAITFGALDHAKGAVLGFQVKNDGADLCVIRGIDLAPGSDPAFRLPGGRIDSFVLAPGAWFARLLAFEPGAEATSVDYTGELELFVVEARATRRMAVPLSARTDDGCLQADPQLLDFGRDRVDCGDHAATVQLRNACDGELGIQAIEIGPGTTDGEFEIRRARQVPFVLPAQDGFSVEVRWRAQTRGPSFSPLFVTEDTRTLPLPVPLLAELLADGRRTDRFVQHAPGSVDLLLVIDNSGSMAEEQQRISAAVGVLVDEARARGIDYRMAVTTTGLTPIDGEPACPGGAKGGEAGRFFPVDGSLPRVVGPETPGGRAVLVANTQVGLCHHLEQGMEAMYLALSQPLVSSADDRRTPQPADGNAGFSRPEAQLAVLFIGEEDDHSGYEVQRYEDFLAQLKGEGGAIVSAIADVDETCAGTSGVAQRYLELATRMGGSASSICAADWTGIFRQIAESSYVHRDSYPLSSTPDGAGLEVWVDGRPAHPSTWLYDPTANDVRFLPGGEPRPGASIEVKYRAACL